MKVWTLTKGGPTCEVTDTGWISGTDPDFLEEVRAAFDRPLDDEGTFPLPGMRGYQEQRIAQLTAEGYRVLAARDA